MMKEYSLFSHIKDDSNLARLFNTVLDKLNIFRIASAPVTFEKKGKSEKDFELFYDTCLWEMYLHKVVSKLNYWISILDKYESEFDSSWEYYASAERIESIKEYGGEAEDYDDKGNIRVQNLTRGDLRFYTVVNDLVQDDWMDIVQETTPEHLEGMVFGLKANAKISFTEIFKKATNQELPMYKQDKDGNMVKMDFSDHAMQKASDEVLADDLSSIVLFVCHGIQLLVKRMRELDPFSDNKNELLSIRRDVASLLNLNFLVHQ